jgi:restriction system protein
MSIPDYQTLMLPLLRRAASGETSVPEIEGPLAEEFGLSPEERNELLPSGRQKVIHNRIHWAKFYLSKAGLVESPRRGRFVATELGKKTLASNPPRIDLELLMEYPSFREFYTSSGTSATNSSDDDPSVPAKRSIPNRTPEEEIDSAYIALQSALRSDLLQRIMQNSPTFFEGVIVDLLVAMGYGGSHRNAATQLGRTGDGGVDGVINEDRLGLDRVYVQAKRFAPGNSVGRPDVQAFVGSLVGLGATKGVFVTTSSFSQQAVDFVRHLTQRVILIDGDRLTALMIEHSVGVRTNRAIEFKRIDEDYFAEDE